MALSPHTSVPFEQKGFNDRKEPRLTPEDLINCDDIIEIAKDKWKSRSLQRSLVEHDVVMTDLIYKKALPVFHQLLNDQYGNYLSQKILEHCSDSQFNAVFDVVRDDFFRLANEVHGTRAVQKFVEEAVRRNRVDTIVECLKPYLESLSHSITGFHVIVKLLEKLPLPKCEDILCVLCKDAASVVGLGIDQWGCCVLKTCVDVAQGARAELIQQAIINSSLSLIQDAYGNYVVQHLLHNDTKQTVLPQMIDKLKDHMLELCQQKFSSNVLEKLLTSASDQHRLRLINCIVNLVGSDSTTVVETLLFHQYGNYVLQQTLAVAKEPEYSLLVDKVRPFIHEVLRTSFGHADMKLPSIRKNNASLATEQAQRLALKLGKRFPSLLEGLEDNIRQAIASPHLNSYDWNNYDWNSSPNMYSGYTNQHMWDPTFYWQNQMKYTGYSPSPMANGKVKRKKSAPSPPAPIHSPPPTYNASTVLPPEKSADGGQAVGRIVGYWPHYTIAYDSEPAAA